ncbi:MAG: hypothetical protein DHS20C21_11450 [Gemmatimonadota bacterium]|nr:MAG: hypothetical protein DHS20C21_11450 [Gemmatimonadota bacterium]
MGAELRCPVRPSRPASIDPGLVSWVNHEAYFFSSKSAKKRFERRPTYWCGTITDPVSLERFRPSGDEPVTYYHGRPFYFASVESRDTFLADPESYRRARNRMTAAADPEDAEAADDLEESDRVVVPTG